MQPFPAEHSVLVLDNCRIHHNEAIAELVQAAGMLQHPLWMTTLIIYSGCLILYLPAYSPDLNPIEESFSARKSFWFMYLLWRF
jgi:transposase